MTIEQTLVPRIDTISDYCLTMGSLFDGIGGFPLAGIRCGVIPLWASEIEGFPIQVTKKHFPYMRHVGDIRELRGEYLQPVDIICGGSPCQDLSVAGARAGLAGSRSSLFLEQIRITREMRYADIRAGCPAFLVRPRLFVWENVPGAFSSGPEKGDDFRVVVEQAMRIAEPTATVPKPAKGCWGPAGFVLGDQSSVAWRVLDAQYWGVPQRRSRIFLVADLGGFAAYKVLFEPESVPRYFTPRYRKRKTLTSPAGICLEDTSGPHLLLPD